MRMRRAFRPVLETMPTLVLPGAAFDPTSPVTVPTDPPPNYVSPITPVTVPVSPTSPPTRHTGPDVGAPIGTMPILIA